MVSHVWVSGPTFFFVMMVYLQFYIGIDRSVSILIMGEILSAPKQTHSMLELKNLYPPTEMVRSRLNLLVEKGLLFKSDQGYYCTPRGSSLAKAVAMVNNIYGLD